MHRICSVGTSAFMPHELILLRGGGGSSAREHPTQGGIVATIPSHSKLLPF